MSESELSASFSAWGGQAVVAVTDAAGLAGARAAVEATIAAVDAACSSFRDDSELAALNRAGGEPVTVSALLLDHVDAALRAAELTSGDVDPTVGEALVTLGFTPPGPGSEPPRLTLQAVPGYRTVHINRATQTIRLGRGVRIDLGATAKALAADQSAQAAAQATGGGVLVALSGDLAIAGPAPAGGWRIRVTDDHRAGARTPGQWISLSTGGLATSSTTVRRRDDAEPGQHHVIDPHTGRPARVHFRTVSVAAASCLDANIASTAAIVRGVGAIDWLASMNLPSRLVELDGSVHHLSGWPEQGEDLGEPAARARAGVAT